MGKHPDAAVRITAWSVFETNLIDDHQDGAYYFSMIGDFF